MKAAAEDVLFVHEARRQAVTTLDTARAAAFAEHALGVVSGGFLSLMMSIGHRTGLFDALAMMPPSTSGEIAEAAGLQERYVREWLGAMVTGRVIHYAPDTRRYHLPREHAGALTRAAGPENLAELAQLVAILGAVETPIVEVFRRGGGVGYEAFDRLHDWMAEASRTTLNATLVSRVLPHVPGLVDQLEAGMEVVDIGCGRGEAVRLMATRFPNSRFLGVDLAADAIAWVREQTTELPNARFEVQDAAAFEGHATYGLVTAFDAIHDQATPRTALRRVYEALRPGGTFLMVDIAASSHLERNLENPLAPLLYTISTMHCTTVSLAAGGEGLGACWGEEKARELLAEAGFARVTTFAVEGDPLNVYYVCSR